MVRTTWRPAAKCHRWEGRRLARRRAVRTGLGVSTLLLLVAGCAEQPTDPGLEIESGTQFSPDNSKREGGAIQDNTSEITEAKVGETFTISLESNPTTGYSWQAEFDAESLELVNEDFTSDSTLLGAGGVQKFDFRALKQGQFQVKMVYKRPWENESIDTKVIDVKVVN